MDDLILPRPHQTRAFDPHSSGGWFSEAPPAMGAVWGRGLRGKPPRGARGETATWHIGVDTSFLINSVFKKRTPNLSEATRTGSRCHPGRSTTGNEPPYYYPLHPTIDHSSHRVFSRAHVEAKAGGLGTWHSHGNHGHHETGAHCLLSKYRCSGAQQYHQEWRGSTPGWHGAPCSGICRRS